MAGRLVIGLATWAIRRRRAQRGSGTPAPTRPVRGAPAELRLVGDPGRLERLAVVRRGTIAVLLPRDRPASLVEPGRYLVPALLPWREPVEVLVVNTEPTTVRLDCAELITADQRTLDPITVRVTVRISERDRFQPVLEAAAEHRAGLEEHLLRRIETEVIAELRAAAAAAQLPGLRSAGLDRLLEGRLPRGTLAGGLLRIETITVSERRDDPAPGPQRPAAEPTETEPPAAAPSTAGPTTSGPGAPTRAVDRPGPTAPSDEVVARRARSPQRLDLRRDPALERVWKRWCDSELVGIASAVEGRTATVVAVADGTVSAWAESRMEEDLRLHLGVSVARLVCLRAESYEELLRSWVSQIDADRGINREALRALLPPTSREAPTAEQYAGR